MDKEKWSGDGHRKDLCTAIAILSVTVVLFLEVSTFKSLGFSFIQFLGCLIGGALITLWTVLLSRTVAKWFYSGHEAEPTHPEHIMVCSALITFCLVFIFIVLIFRG